jgi:hypothetical protein
MSTSYAAPNARENPVRGSNGIQTEHAVAGLVIGSVIALWLVRRGFGIGAGIPGVASVNIGK